MSIYGWDASDYDHGRGAMDMAAARRDGIDFYTHKATEGTANKHHPGPSMTAARDAGIPFLGCYLVPRSGPTVSSQVDYFLAWVDQQVPWWRDFPGWFWQVDTEHWSYDQVSAQRGHDVAQLLAQRTGKRVLHYAPKWAYGDSVPAGEPLWASSYVSGSGHYRSLYPGDNSSKWAAYSGRVPTILQYSSSARIGTQSTCDANAFRGTVADFAKLIGVDAPIGGDGMFMIRKDDEREVYVFDDHGRKRWHVQTEKERDWLHANGMALHDGCSPDLYEALTTPGTDPAGPAVVPTDEQWASFTQSVVEKVDAGLGDAMLTALESDRGQAALVRAADTAEDH